MTEIIGSVAGILTTFAFFPQVVKTVRSRSTDDLSWSWLVMMSVGVFLWMVYGLDLNSLSLIGANAVTFCCVVILLWVKVSNYRRGK